MSLPVGVQLYSVRTDCESDIVSTLKELKNYGYDGVEFAGLCGLSPKEMAKLLVNVGLEPMGAHVGIHEVRADAKKVISDYREVGCKNIAIPWLDEADRPGGENYANTLKTMREFGILCREAGMVLSYHNHDFEFVKDKNGVYAFDKLYKDIPADILMTEQDTCWVAVAGEDPAEYLKKYKGRCPLVHLKDYYGEKQEGMYNLIGGARASESLKGFEYRPLGKGMQNIPAVCAAALEAEAEGFIVEQDEPSMGLSRMECVRLSREYLKTIGY